MYWLPLILILPYILILLRIYRWLKKIRPFKITTDPGIFVSVVIACHNEEKNLHSLLGCITSQTYPKELFEVIIVDDNSTDRTFEIASGFINPSNINVIRNKGKGKKLAIRSGIKASSGILIITTDADCMMGEKWIKTIASFFDQHRPDMIICPVRIDAGEKFFRRFQELEFLSLQGITAGSAYSGHGVMCNGANLSFTRDTYHNHSDNLHDRIASGDDIFLLHSLKKQKNSKILWLESNDAMVTASAAPTTLSFIKQRRRWISKWNAYNDPFTILLAIVTFVTILLQVSSFVAGFFNPIFWIIFMLAFILKSVPDFLILKNTVQRYGTRELIKWFVPAQIVYPFYVLGVVFYSLISHKQRNINSPFLKEI